MTQALDNAKWTSWSGLGNMPPMEAMRLYVRTLEEDVVRRLHVLLPDCQLLSSAALLAPSNPAYLWSHDTH